MKLLTLHDVDSVKQRACSKLTGDAVTAGLWLWRTGDAPPGWQPYRYLLQMLFLKKSTTTLKLTNNRNGQKQKSCSLNTGACRKLRNKMAANITKLPFLSLSNSFFVFSLSPPLFFFLLWHRGFNLNSSNEPTTAFGMEIQTADDAHTPVN